MGTNNTGRNCRVEAYPRANSNADTALSNHEQGAITADPPNGLASGQIVATLVVPVDVSGNFLVNFSFSYNATADGTPEIFWVLSRRTGAFLVNGLPPVPGFYLFPTDTGGTSTILMTTEQLATTPDAHHEHALDISGQPVGAFVAYELTFVSGVLPTLIHFTGATPTAPQGQASVLEVL